MTNARPHPRRVGRLVVAGLFVGALLVLIGMPRLGTARGAQPPAARGHTSVVVMAADPGCGPRDLAMDAPGDLFVEFHNHGHEDLALTIVGVPGRLEAEPDGGIVTGDFTIPQPGTYTFWCAPPERQQPLMRGTLTVRSGAAR